MRRRLIVRRWLLRGVYSIVAVGLAAGVVARPFLGRVQAGSDPSLAVNSEPNTAESPEASTAVGKAKAEIAALRSGHPGVDVSVAAYNTVTGVTFSDGLENGITSASVAKLDILLSALLQATRQGRTLSASERRLSVPMITASDNAAAQALFTSIGGMRTLRDANNAFELTETKLDGHGRWGLTTTSATDQIRLLRQLVEEEALDQQSRDYAVGLMKDVERDQAWGVSAAADEGTAVALKNGWLNVRADGGRWAVNSVGIVTVNGKRVLLAVLTCHHKSLSAGTDFVEDLATTAARAVA